PGVGWSPNGRTMAFPRTQPDGQWSAVVIANADGSEERIIARREVSLTFVTALNLGMPVSRLAWSPDGREILVVGVAFFPEGREPETELVFLDSIRGGKTSESPIRRTGGAPGCLDEQQPLDAGKRLGWIFYNDRFNK